MGYRMASGVFLQRPSKGMNQTNQGVSAKGIQRSTDVLTLLRQTIFYLDRIAAVLIRDQYQPAIGEEIAAGSLAGDSTAETVFSPGAVR